MLLLFTMDQILKLVLRWIRVSFTYLIQEDRYIYQTIQVESLDGYYVKDLCF